MRPTPSLLGQHPIQRGSHRRRDDGLCAMEMVAWLAGEEHSDAPRCACPVIGAFVRAFNDNLPDDGVREAYLRRLIPRLVNSRGSRSDERVRGYGLLDAAVRIFAPAKLEAAGDLAGGATLAALPPVVDALSVLAAHDALRRYGRQLRAACWVVERAVAGDPPERWAAAVARALPGPESWAIAAEIVADLVAVRAPAGVER